MSRTVLRCGFCPWRATVAPDDTSESLSHAHLEHLTHHVNDMIRTALLPYDDDVFLPELPPISSD